MQDIDGVQAGGRPAKVGQEFIGIDDYHGLVEMLELVADRLDASASAAGGLPKRLRALRKNHAFVLKG